MGLSVGGGSEATDGRQVVPEEKKVERRLEVVTVNCGWTCGSRTLI
jgi:hypothetical protein